MVLRVPPTAAFGLGFLCHFIRDWCDRDTSAIQLQVDIAGFRGELVKAEQAILRAHQSLDSCLSWVSIQGVVIRLLVLVLIQCIAIIVVWWWWKTDRKPTAVEPVVSVGSPVSIDNDSLEQAQLSIGDCDQVPEVKPLPKGPTRPSDLKKVGLKHGGR